MRLRAPMADMFLGVIMGHGFFSHPAKSEDSFTE